MELIVAMLSISTLGLGVSVILLCKALLRLQGSFSGLQDQFLQQLSQDNRFYRLIAESYRKIDASVELMNETLDSALNNREDSFQGDEHEQR